MSDNIMEPCDACVKSDVCDYALTPERLPCKYFLSAPKHTDTECGRCLRIRKEGDGWVWDEDEVIDLCPQCQIEYWKAERDELKAKLDGLFQEHMKLAKVANDEIERLKKELLDARPKIEGAGCTYTQNEDDCYKCEMEGKRICPYKREAKR